MHTERAIQMGSQPADTSRLPVSQAELYGILFDNDILEMVVENRFCEMMKYLHVSDNATIQADAKMSKNWPLLIMLNDKFIHYFEFLKTQNLSIDESMVPYYGRQSAKQFILVNQFVLVIRRGS